MNGEGCVTQFSTSYTMVMNGNKNSYCTYCKGNDNSIMKFFSSFGKVISFLK